MTVYLSEHDAARLGIEGAKPRTKRGRTTRPDLPAAGCSPSTGLTSLIAGKTRAWSLAFEPARGFRMYVINDAARDTGWQADEATCCEVAKRMG